MAAAPAGWLVCDGSLKLRATYAALFAAIGVLYGAGDGATTFALPDLRGEFLRGLDGGRNVDAGRALGSAQADAFKSHTHSMGLALSQAAFTAQNPALLANGSAQTAATGGAETRPRNIALLACISTGA
jgi:microcystin-dependent protein